MTWHTGQLLKYFSSYTRNVFFSSILYANHIFLSHYKGWETLYACNLYFIWKQGGWFFLCFKRIPYSILAIPHKIVFASFLRQCFTCTKRNTVYIPLSIKGIYFLLVQHNYQHHFTTLITKRQGTSNSLTAWVNYQMLSLQYAKQLCKGKTPS